jgi:hypothetical protein
VDHHFHGWIQNGRPAGISVAAFDHSHVWTRVRHESIGGITRFAARLCSNMDTDPVIETLTRTIHHAVDYSIRPACIKGDDPRVGQSLNLKSRLFPRNFQQTVLYPTRFCCMGVRIRSLTGNERAHAFGLPIICQGGDLSVSELNHFLPCHVGFSFHSKGASDYYYVSHIKAISFTFVYIHL